MQTVVRVENGKDATGKPKYETLKDLPSGAAGAFWIGKLPYGTYYLQETAAPGGYTKPTKYFQFKVDENGVSYLKTTTTGEASTTAWTPTNTLTANGPDVPAPSTGSGSTGGDSTGGGSTGGGSTGSASKDSSSGS